VNPVTRTPDGDPHQCSVCGGTVTIEPSSAGDAPCPHCGCLLWFPGGAGDAAFPRFTVSNAAIRGKEQAIAVVLDRLAADGILSAAHQPEVLAAILKREQLGSTAIGRGVALPHARCASVTRLVGAIAEFPAGVDFASTDGAPVHIVCLMVCPADRPGSHLRALEALVRRFRQ